MEFINTYTAALARRIYIPTTKEGWLDVLLCAVIFVASYFVVDILIKGTSLDEGKKQTIRKWVPLVITIISMFFVKI